MKKCCEINFTIQEQVLGFTIENTKYDFQADLGYLVGGTTSYVPLSDKPQINYKILQAGNNTYEYLGVEPEIIDITEQDIDNLIYG